MAKRLGLSMPDVPHDELIALLLDAWDWVVYKTGHTRKQMYRKVRIAQQGSGCSRAGRRKDVSAKLVSSIWGMIYTGSLELHHRRFVLPLTIITHRYA